MKEVSLVLWHGPRSMAHAIANEKYPNYGLLIEGQDGAEIILHTNRHEQLAITARSSVRADLKEITKVEIPEEVCASVVASFEARKAISDFKETFVGIVDTYKGVLGEQT